MIYGLDPLYWIMMIPVVILSGYASMKVKSTFNKYSQKHVASGLSGAEVARKILDRQGLSNINVEQTQGFLSDHYDPSAKVLRLSPGVYSGRNIAALGVAAHEAGHAIQDLKNYVPLKLRSAMVPLASIGSNFSWIAIMAGFFLRFMGLVKIGIILFCIIVVFQIVTLPVEFDASSRAKVILRDMAFINGEEAKGVSKVLNAAALTYVAAALSSIMTLLYFLIRSGILGGGDGD